MELPSLPDDWPEHLAVPAATRAPDAAQPIARRRNANTRRSSTVLPYGDREAPMRELIPLAALLLTLLVASPVAEAEPAARSRSPIIDVHLHAFDLPDGEEPPPNPVTGRPSASRTKAELRDASLSALARYNIVKAVTSGPAATVAQWQAAAPERILVGAFVDESHPLPDLSELRAKIRSGQVHVLGELSLQYRGMALNDPRLEPYYALAEELDIPVGVHTGIGPPGTPYLPCFPQFRVTLGNPVLIEEVLVRHPRLRLYLMHGGAPYVQETKAIMSVYPQVYADLSVINWVLPREEFHAYLR